MIFYERVESWTKHHCRIILPLLGLTWVLNIFAFPVFSDSSQLNVSAWNDSEHGHQITIDLGNDVKLEIIYIQSGGFYMGQTEKETEWLVSEYGSQTYNRFHGDELPRREVTLDGFWIGKHSITVSQFKRFVDETGYKTRAEREGSGFGYDMQVRRMNSKRDINWNNPGWEQGDDHPVVLVSWEDAMAFCRWISDKTGQNFTLPTEAQWEYAARAGTTTMFFWGDSPDDGEGYINAADKSGTPCGDTYQNAFNFNDGFIYTAPVNSFKPNPWGLYNMLGNIWEWCLDWHHPNYYANAPSNNPTGPESGRLRVRRGGRWSLDPSRNRTAFRHTGLPHYRCDGLGFRLVVLPE
jgi:formylglycine-generating enzyme required for sulfatase activity